MLQKSIDQLSHLKYGYPMWRPEPSNAESVMVGDIGTIINGQFQHMFNAPRTADHRYNRGATPDDFQQLIFDSATTIQYDTTFLDANVYHSKSVHVTKLPKTTEQSTSPNTASVSFSCAGNNGRLLAIPSPADRCSVSSNQRRLFVDYIKAYHEAWCTLAADRFALISHPEDIILVRGWVKTAAFTVAAITHKEIDTISTMRYQWSTIPRERPRFWCFSPPIHSSPLGSESSTEDIRRSPLPEVEPTDPTLYPFQEIPKLRDQCIFLSFYKLKRGGILPERIVAYAPSDGEDYILRHSDVDLAIACDEDVYEVCEGHPWPADFREFYERVSPRIHVDEDRAATLYREEYLPYSVPRRDSAVGDVKHSNLFLKSNTIDYDILLASSTHRVSEPLLGTIPEPLIVFCLQNTLLSQFNLLRTSQMFTNQYYDQVSEYLRFDDNISPTSSPPLLL
ncbi:hypothetical protein ABKN59_004879 [Abortiporus biennis]